MLRATLTIISSFIAMITIGMVLLLLPFATVDSELSLVDAFFTSTSAVCVTGLTVVDTAAKFTLFGKIIILIMLQLGGLGIITFSAMVLLFLGRKLTLRQREVINTTQAPNSLAFDLKQVAKPVLAYVVLSEGVGIIVLFFSFLRYFPWDKALFHAVFHSISAFCNAGFSSFSTSLAAYSGDWLVCLPVMALIMLGGLGFVVMLDVYETVRFNKPIYIHTKLVAVTTGILLVLGALIFFVMEMNNAMVDKPLHEQVLMSMFHSVTTRTAGFNTVNYFDLTHGTLVVTFILMFIGGSPGSTAGGIKTTTIAIIILTAIARIKGIKDPEFANRAISPRSVTDSITLITLGMFFVIFVILVLQVTELGTVPHVEAEGTLMSLSFESVSAFGTVGLSMGATSGLSALGKIVVSITMFIGRLGPLTFFYLLGSRRKKAQYRLYPETVMVG